METGNRILGAFVAAAALAAGTGLRAETLVADSPFAPSGVMAAAATQRGEAYELAGASSDGAKVNVCIYEREHRHSQWIQVGSIVDGIRVVSYDGSKDTAVVIIGGSQKLLTMRKATSGARPVAAVARAEPSVTTSAPPPTVAPEPAARTAAAQDQREARMLVSDLLEIGAQQRKAYQDAKQKEAAGGATAPQN